jgi:hypothetical protein
VKYIVGESENFSDNLFQFDYIRLFSNLIDVIPVGSENEK